MNGWIQSFIGITERLIVPYLCPLCDQEIGNPGLCGICWSCLKFITNPACLHCGRPFEIPLPRHICLGCQIDPPDYDHAVAALIYADPTRQLILGLKHGDRQDIAPILAQLMLPKTQSLIQDADYVLPLPLHRRRFFKRRFNQSAELARYLTRRAGHRGKLNTKLLLRRKNTESQGHKTKAQRIQSMRGAFFVPPDQKHHVMGRHILIIDDVQTTGASLSSAARSLKRAGARRVSVSTLALVC